ncbi:STAS domain-containing protein [Kitasatospora sp. NPDC057015]|uniref:STAS domain-containing protein n=1 Tax=Kitasatospora sp. NPDC057015 TaxID=3346001 RepID=UPI0036426550
MNDPANSAATAAPGGPGAEVRRTDAGALVCSLAGELDLDGVLAVGPTLEEAVRAGAPLMVVDLSRVGFCDSSGLNLLLRTRTDADSAGTALRLAAAPDQLLRLLEITGADRVFALDPTLELALAAR